MFYYLRSGFIWWKRRLVIHNYEQLQTIFSFVENFIHIHIYIEQNHSDDSAIAIVFLRAKRAGATVVHVQIWTHDIPFNNDL